MKKLIIILLLFVGFCVQAQDAADYKASTIFSAYQVEKAPDFPGGINAFLRYVQMNYRTPKVDGNLSLTIKYGFVVETDGSISNITVTNDVAENFKAELIWVIAKCPTRWIPAEKDKIPVRCVYENLIQITIKDE